MAGHSSTQSVDFILKGEDENIQTSYAEVKHHELYNPTGRPSNGGVIDLRMGTVDHSNLCLTCLNGKKLCPGHVGSIRLKVSVIQPIAIAEIRGWLRIICFKCGTIVVDGSKYLHLPNSKRFKEAVKVDTVGKLCPFPNCNAIHPKIIKDPDDYFTFLFEYSTLDKKLMKGASNSEKLYPDIIKSIFERVSDSSVLSLGKSLNVHPRKLVTRVIPVMPPTQRPNVRSYGTSSSSSHDCTTMLQNIVKRVNQLPDRLPDNMTMLNAGGPIDQDLDRSLHNLLQLYYDMIIGSPTGNVSQSNTGKRSIMIGTRPVKSLYKAIKGKDGRIRSNLLGGRSLDIGRSTISGNSLFRIDEIGIPISFARVLQVEVVVQIYNRDWLMTFLLNGKHQYPGCTKIKRCKTGEMHDISGLREFRLEIGDTLYRDIINGDFVFFNRAPTLERSSIGVHKVIVIEDPGIHTIQMNVLACEFYNADFDGDQMTVWVAHSVGTRIEAMIMSSVNNWFISTKTSGPVNGQVQDSILGCYELTRNNIIMDKYHAMNLFTTAGLDSIVFDADTYTGRDIVSKLLEKTPINYKGVPSSYSDVYAPYISFEKEEIYTVIENGRMLKGVLDKPSVGAGANGGIFHLISREYGPQKALDMIYAFQQVSLQLLISRGFTVGTADLIPSSESLKEIHSIVSDVELEANTITNRLLRGEIVPPIGKTVHQFYELMQINALKIPSEILRWVLKTVNPNSNGFFRMIAVGSKGKNPNLIHVSGVIGQTLINGVRIPTQFSFGRTSPYFARSATSAAAFGFVRNSYISGMTTSEYIFQAMAGRFDLISKSLTTAATGYFMRKGAMSNNSACVNRLRQVSKDTKIVQMLYGEDGMDSRELEEVKFRNILLSDAELLESIYVKVDTKHQDVVDTAVKKIQEDRNKFRSIFLRVEAAGASQQFVSSLLMAVNVERIVTGVLINTKINIPFNSKGIIDRINAVNDLCSSIPYTFLNEIQERRKSVIPPHLNAAVYLMQILIRAELNPKILTRISKEQLDYIIETIRHRYSNSTIDYGTAVGIIAAQALSEPLTQYMLDSHHRSIEGGTTTSGLVRVSEVYGARKVSEEKSSAMLIPLNLELLGDSKNAFTIAQEIANSIEYVTLNRFVSRYEIIIEPYSGLIYPLYLSDAKWIKEYERSHPLILIPKDLTNWCFRFTLDKSSMVFKAVDMELIVKRIRIRTPGLFVVHTQESVNDVVIRVWYRASQFKRSVDTGAYIQSLAQDILNTPIRGIRDILSAKAEKMTRMQVDEKGALVKSDYIAIKTTGTNLYQMLLHKAVDHNAIHTNSVGDTVKILGIEAGRSKIIYETRAFMQGNTPNLRHLYLYADEMTRTGKVTSIERSGLNAREHSNILLRMAYEAPIQVITNATLSSTRSRIYGIAAPQILGSIPRIGTLYCDFRVDDAYVQENTITLDSILDNL